MNKELPNGYWVVKDRDALADDLKKLPFLEVKRKDWKDGRYAFRVLVKRDMGNLTNRINRFMGFATIAYIRNPLEGDFVKVPRIMCGDGWSPLKGVVKIPTFDNAREYIAVLEKHIDTSFDYDALQNRVRKATAASLLSIATLIPFVYAGTKAMDALLKTSSVTNALIFSSWIAVTVLVFFFVYFNLEVLFEINEVNRGKWWIPATYFVKKKRA